jgi:DegV family protein with EDD domain
VESLKSRRNLVKVVVDSTADLPPALATEWEITVVPCLVHFGRQTFREGVDLPRAEFYRRLEVGPELPTTSAPGPGVFASAYRQLAAEVDQIVSIHLSSKLSAVYNSARLGADEIQDIEIAVVDSNTVSMGLGWLAVIAARAARAGRSLREIVSLLEAARLRARVFALLDTLEYLRRGGRVSRVVAALGALLNVKPIISVNEGEVLPLGRIRSRHKAVARLVSLVEELGPLAELAVLHTCAHDAAEALANRLAGPFPRERIVIAEVGTIIGTHVGPNGLGVACLMAK